MFMMRFPLNKVYWSSISQHYCKHKPSLTSAVFVRLSSKTSYYVLLPEVPDDTAETNPLLKDNEFLSFDGLDAEKCYKGMGKRFLDHEEHIFELERKIKDASEPVTFSNVIGEIEKLDVRLTFPWCTVKNLLFLHSDILPISCFRKISERVTKAFSLRFTSPVIYEASKEIRKKENLNPLQKRVVERLLLDAELNGVALEGNKKNAFIETLQKIRQFKEIYKNKLEFSNQRFSYRIIDYGIVKDFPEELLKNMADNKKEYLKGPWTVTHNPNVYHEFMKYCPHKDLRLNAWNAYIIRSSSYLDSELNSGMEVTEIRYNRQYLARQIDYETFAHMSMVSKMAGSVDNVLGVIKSIFPKVKEKQLSELKSLKEFAWQNGFQGELEECDIPFWRRKQMLRIANMGEEKMENYFPFSHVWKQLLSFCSNLFDVQFEDVTTQVETWDPHVSFYNVLDSDGKKLSSFYIDPFKRFGRKLNTDFSGLEQMQFGANLVRGRCDAVGDLPLVSIINNFNTPSPKYNKESLLSFTDVNNLFRQFGFALHDLLSTVPYNSITGHANVEWDALEVSSKVMEFWLQDPSVVEMISKHYITGEPLSREGSIAFTKAAKHMSAHDLSNDLFLSLLDIRFHTEETVFYEIMEQLWKEHVPFPFKKRDYMACWFDAIMTGNFPAAYYCCWWSKMIAADIFQAFKECEAHEAADVGKRYRDIFLSVGGGYEAAKLFRKFRGRDPVPEALLVLLGIS